MRDWRVREAEGGVCAPVCTEKPAYCTIVPPPFQIFFGNFAIDTAAK
jgi:hypothetical protein